MAVAGVGQVAQAGPSVRFGLTGALDDQSAPQETEFGPTFALGERVGPLMLEADYAYLSFFDPDTSNGGMHRLGLNLRADLLRSTNHYCFRGMACTRGASLYGEAGVAERFGQWHLDASTRSPADTDRVHEVHIGAGIELDNHIHPYRYGWQLGIRLAVAPHDPLEVDPSCRGTCTMSTSAGTTTSKTTGMDRAVLIEWTFLIGQ
nr:hypothetical protein [Kofleriaceae bacterium]